MSGGTPSGWSAELPRRAAVGAILIVVALAALYFGGFAMWALVAAASLIMTGEWADLAKTSPERRKLVRLAIVVPLAILSPLAAGADAFAFGIVLATALFILIVTRSPRLAGGMLYVGIPAFALILIRAQPQGLLLAFWTLATVWATDIGAYFSGRLIGGPKLLPRISPSKTWAGLIGGMVCALLVGLGFHAWGGLDRGLALASPLLAVLAQIGDLYESSLKRAAGVKDSGTMLPGHGGVMDRLDGVITVAPAVALLLVAGVAA
ncbi:MAG: phosphatidate cytidylyltransferase [Sphingomonas sanxanigenens]|uniref:Phosphatidate cytidylyltransferase n=1 Tax=Sphingomonas sanxanigenens TaxID=397260 RepID=A0A2W5A3D9_9SPHN|nr:MAG: phosphatidate cytidylyltransferase [Sphingomonas sanxanigenens]